MNCYDVLTVMNDFNQKWDWTEVMDCFVYILLHALGISITALNIFSHSCPNTQGFNLRKKKIETKPCQKSSSLHMRKCKLFAVRHAQHHQTFPKFHPTSHKCEKSTFKHSPVLILAHVLVSLIAVWRSWETVVIIQPFSWNSMKASTCRDSWITARVCACECARVLV